MKMNTKTKKITMKKKTMKSMMTKMTTILKMSTMSTTKMKKTKITMKTKKVMKTKKKAEAHVAAAAVPAHRDLEAWTHAVSARSPQWADALPTVVTEAALLHVEADVAQEVLPLPVVHAMVVAAHHAAEAVRATDVALQEWTHAVSVK